MTAGAKKRHVLLGVAIGLAASLLLLSADLGGVGRTTPSAGPLLSDCDGTIRQAVIHYTPETADVVAPTYRTFLRQLPAEVTVREVTGAPCQNVGDPTKRQSITGPCRSDFATAYRESVTALLASVA